MMFNQRCCDFPASTGLSSVRPSTVDIREHLVILMISWNSQGESFLEIPFSPSDLFQECSVIAPGNHGWVFVAQRKHG